MLLNSVNKSIEVKLDGSVATTQASVVVFWADHTTSTLVPGCTDVLTNNTTAVAIVGAPAANTQRQVKTITIYNGDTHNITLTVRINDNSVIRNILKIIMAPSDTLQYQEGKGWSVINNSGYIKHSSNGSSSGGSGGPGASGYSGYSGTNGTNGTNGTIGSNGASGYSGYSGYSGASGYSGVTINKTNVLMYIGI